MFGQSGTGTGDLLLGRGGFEGSVGNGFSNEREASGSGNSTGTPGPNGSSALDLNDFPTLAGSSGGENNSLAAALRQQQQLIAQQQILQGAQGNNVKSQSPNLYRLAMGTHSLGPTTGSNTGNFNMATEDFPALPGAPPSGSGGNNGSSGSGLLGGVEGGQRDLVAGPSTSSASFGNSAPPTSRSSSNGSGTGMFGGDLDGLTNQLDSATLLGGVGGIGNLSNQSSNNPSISQQQRPSSQSTGGTSVSSGAGSGSGQSGGAALSGDFGLLGLLGVIRMSDADRNALALGSDLTTLGLNLNSSDQLFSTFASPWSESPTTREPQYQLPMCYYMTPPALKTGHLSKFQLETLFYIFYALPKDVLQAYAAQELYSREWRYHVDLKLWFKRASPADGVASSGNGVQYIYFDLNSWERRLFNGNMNQNITSGLLSEEDIRVKFPNS